MHDESKKPELINDFLGEYSMSYNIGNDSYVDVRKVLALQGDRSLTLVLPKEFAVKLGIGKGDFLECSVESQRLIIEKVEGHAENQ
jgi:hypothetical protein